VFRRVHLSSQSADLKSLDVVFSFNIKSCSKKYCFKKLMITINDFASVFYMFYLSIIIVVGKVTLYFCTSYFLYRNKAVYT